MQTGKKRTLQDVTPLLDLDFTKVTAVPVVKSNATTPEDLVKLAVVHPVKVQVHVANVVDCSCTL